MITDKKVQWFIKPVLFLVCLLPFFTLVAGAINQSLGVNPVETMTHETGDWTLRFLLITLLVTPLRKITGASWLIKLRRMLGLFAFFYAVLHFITYIWFDQYFDLMEIAKDIPKRPFITVGFIAFVLLIPLALTSTNKMMKRLKRNWAKLHKLVYVIAVLGCLHFLWLVKADTFEPLVYFLILLALLAFRAYQDRFNNISPQRTQR
ncbi:MAG: protein-methionine-sulfoxide reductase heme-binding subunit MsrQ [Gammaproteobacteria bacterium]